MISPGSVAENGGRIFGKSKLDVLFVESALQLGKDLLQDRPWVDVDTTMRGLFDSRKIEHVMQQSLHVLARLLDPIHEMQTRLVEHVAIVVAKEAGKTEQRGKR